MELKALGQAPAGHACPCRFGDGTERRLAPDRHINRQGLCSVGICACRFDRDRRSQRKAVAFIDAIDVDRCSGSCSIRSRRRTYDGSNGGTQEHHSSEALETATEDLAHDARPERFRLKGWAALSLEDLFRTARDKSSWTLVHWTEVQSQDPPTQELRAMRR